MLNINQRKAVFANDRFIFLLAGAGSGKTRVIVERIKRLISEKVKPENILAISFTRKSAYVLKKRLSFADDILVTTFHGFCYKMIKDLQNIEIIEEAKLIEYGFTKDDLIKIEVLKRNQKKSLLVNKYQQTLKKENKLDFIDLEIIFNRRLNQDKTFKKKLNMQYKYIFVDEFQDTSVIQLALIKHFKTEANNIFCVGDPNQSIYTFRGASKRVIDEYIKYFKAKIYWLDLNYRSAANIVDLANNLITKNNQAFKIKLFSFNKKAGVINIRSFSSFKNQAQTILSIIREKLKAGFKQEQIAIIYRNHYLAKEIKEELEKTYFEKIAFFTIHQVKGLEFEVVIVIGLEEGNLPMRNANIQEERRLFYVAITRAKKELYLFSVIKDNKSSRFIKECFK